jgi:hypothetical protein
LAEFRQGDWREKPEERCRRLIGKNLTIFALLSEDYDGNSSKCDEKSRRGQEMNATLRLRSFLVL